MRKIILFIIIILLSAITVMGTQNIYEDMDLQNKKISSILAIYLTDTATNLYKDASGNMNFVDTVTGGRTLAQLATSGGITTLNGLTAATQTFATGTTGTDFNVSSATSTHTLNIPSASGTNRGLLTSADWTTFNNKEPAITNLEVAKMPVGGTWNITSDIDTVLATNAEQFIISTPRETTVTPLWIRTNSGTGIAGDANLIVFYGRSSTPNTQETGRFGGITLDPTGFNGGFVIYTTSAGVSSEKVRIDNSGNAGFNTTNQFGGGAGVIGLANATTEPTSAPVGGIILYSLNGVLKIYQSNGTRGTVSITPD